ncbi:MAG: response regulator transcription factor [Halieaceae bacterium]|nr:response regulator transcription factor [Halieaceae bacterium]
MDVLLVEDDKSVAKYICDGLRSAGVQVNWADDGDAGLACARRGHYDVMVVDRMLPGIDGLSLVRTLRAEGNGTPILILSALGEVDDRVGGLQAGADDYLGKPFAFAELEARLEVLARRGGDNAAPTELSVGDLNMDLLAQAVTRSGKPIRLQPREYKLLEFLLRNAGQVVTRAMLLEHVWGYHFDPQTNVIDVHISRLRQKIDREFDEPLLHTVRGAGYRLAPGGQDSR